MIDKDLEIIINRCLSILAEASEWARVDDVNGHAGEIAKEGLIEITARLKQYKEDKNET